jgi:hypothetical protein
MLPASTFSGSIVQLRGVTYWWGGVMNYATPWQGSSDRGADSINPLCRRASRLRTPTIHWRLRVTSSRVSSKPSRRHCNNRSPARTGSPDHKLPP